MCKRYEPRFKILPSGDYQYEKIKLLHDENENIKKKRQVDFSKISTSTKFKFRPNQSIDRSKGDRISIKYEEMSKVRTNEINARLPSNLSMLEIFQAYESHSQRLLQDLLAGGYHESYDILFNLILDNRNRLKGQVKDLIPLLENQPEKLTMIVVYLKQAEYAIYEGHFELRYTSHRNLAKEIIDQEPEIGYQFFETSLANALLEGWDNIRALGEAHRNLGFYIQKTDLERAHAHYLTYYQIMKANRNIKFDSDSDTMFPDGEKMFSDACHMLASTYMEYGIYKMNLRNYSESFDSFNKAHLIALEDTDKYLLAKTLRNLGDITLLKRDFQHSLEYFKEYLNLCTKIGDRDLIANANEALGSIYVKLENLNQANKYYTECVKISHESEDKMAYASSCIFVGQVQNNAGLYMAAYEYFDTAFKQTKNKIELHKANVTSRALCGVAKANMMRTFYNRYIFVNNTAVRDVLLDWKEFRINNFVKDVPLFVNKVRREIRLIQLQASYISDMRKKQMPTVKVKNTGNK